MAKRRGHHAPCTIVSGPHDFPRSPGVPLREGNQRGRLRAAVLHHRGRSSRKPIGWTSLDIHGWTRRATGADIGVAIGEKDRWKKGYGTEVVRLLLREAFEQLNLHRVTWWTFAENEASLALAKKMGFKEEGRTRDSVFFDNRYHDSVILGLLRDEYDASSKPSLSPRPKRSMRTKSS